MHRVFDLFVSLSGLFFSCSLMIFSLLRLHSISPSHFFFFILPQSGRHFWQSYNTVYLQNISLLCMSVIKQTCYSHETLQNIQLKKNTLKCTAFYGYCVTELQTTQTMISSTEQQAVHASAVTHWNTAGVLEGWRDQEILSHGRGLQESAL
jgi:hypothetical protein